MYDPSGGKGRRQVDDTGEGERGGTINRRRLGGRKAVCLIEMGTVDEREK